MTRFYLFSMSHNLPCSRSMPIRVNDVTVRCVLLSVTAAASFSVAPSLLSIFYLSQTQPASALCPLPRPRATPAGRGHQAALPEVSARRTHHWRRRRRIARASGAVRPREPHARGRREQGRRPRRAARLRIQGADDAGRARRRGMYFLSLRSELKSVCAPLCLCLCVCLHRAADTQKLMLAIHYFLCALIRFAFPFAIPTHLFGHPRVLFFLARVRLCPPLSPVFSICPPPHHSHFRPLHLSISSSSSSLPPPSIALSFHTSTRCTRTRCTFGRAARTS